MNLFDRDTRPYATCINHSSLLSYLLMLGFECYFEFLLLLPFLPSLSLHQLFSSFPWVDLLDAWVRLLTVFVFSFLVLVFILRGCSLFVSGLALLFFGLLLFHLLSDRNQTVKTIYWDFELLVQYYLIDVTFLGLRNVLYYSRMVVQVRVGWQNSLSIPFVGLVLRRIRCYVIWISGICLILHLLLNGQRFFL